MATLSVVNPATGEVRTQVQAASPQEVVAAVDRARMAQRGWAALPFCERARALRRLARRLRDDAQLLELIRAESGKPRYEAEAIELFYTLELTRYYTGRAGRRTLADDLRRPFVFAYKRARVVHHARGVVGVIGPWNWPLLNNYADCVAPLVCGNAVVLKPSPVAPLTSLRVAELWRAEGLPPEVFQVVPGGIEAGEALAGAVDMIFFTGSHAAGKKVAAAAGARLIPCVVELGGKSPMVVLADADLPRAARLAVWSAFANSGQVCIRTERLIVEQPVADELIRLIAVEMAGLRHAPPTDADDGVDVGAIAMEAQVQHLEKQLAEALAAGARVVAGGARRTDLGGGRFFSPTLLADVTPAMAVAREETFGPLLPVLVVRDAEEAVRLANDTPFGLSGSVWSRDARRAAAIARRIEAGSVCVNDALLNYFCVEAPLGGVKGSGLGVRHGPEALRQFCRLETILEDHPLLGWLSPLIGRQLGFPYQGRVLRVLRWLMRRLYAF